MTNKNFPETYYQTLREVFWPFRLKKTWIMAITVKKIWKKLQKLSKNAEVLDNKIWQDFRLHKQNKK